MDRGSPDAFEGPNRGPLRDRSGCSPVEAGAGNGKDRSMNPHTPHPGEGPASADRPATDRSHPELPESELPEPEPPATDLPHTERSVTDLPHTERPDPELPGTGQPAPAF